MIDQLSFVDAVVGLQSLPDDCIPLTVTSPPYDGLREYGGHGFDHETFGRVARELWRVTMPGGVVAWVVADEIDGGYSGTGLRQALHFQGLGFRLHDILIMTRSGGRYAGGNRYGKVEFGFILSKGRPRSVHLIRDRPNKHAGVLRRFRARRADGGRGSRLGSSRSQSSGSRGRSGSIWPDAAARPRTATPTATPP